MPSAQKFFRVPLSGSYTNRTGTTTTADTASGYVGIGIVGTMIVGARTSATNKDRRFLNCFTQTVIDETTGQKRVFRVKRPGWGTYITPSSGNIGSAIMVWTGSGAGTACISAFGTTNSTIYNETTSLGAITGQATSISETFVTTTPTLTVPSSDSTAWYYDTGVAVMTKISDGDFPGNAGYTLAGDFAHMDGFAFIMTTDAKLWASDLNSVTAWTANSYTSVSSYPDKGVGCIRYKEMVMAFGTDSVEFYYNAGLTPFPLQVIGNMTVRVGCVSAKALTQMADAVFWIGSPPQGGLSLFMYDGSVQRVSTPDIDAILILAGATSITLTTARFYGRSFVIVNAGASTLVYCMEEKNWHEWSSTTPLWYKCAGVSVGTTILTYALHNVQTSGKVYVMNPVAHVFTDDSVAYTARMQLSPMDFGTKVPKVWDELEIVGDVETAASLLTLSYSDDDYQTYGTYGTLDLTKTRPRASRLGSSSRRAWVLTHSSATPMRLEAIEGRATTTNRTSRIP